MDGVGVLPQVSRLWGAFWDADSHEHHLRNVALETVSLRGTWLASENFRARFSLASEHVPGQTKEGPWSYAPGAALLASLVEGPSSAHPHCEGAVRWGLPGSTHPRGRAYHQKQVFLAS